ncbi:MAG: DUF6440 domain-containing protein [Eubacteriales bacterium]|jgi:hypothetical protein
MKEKRFKVVYSQGAMEITRILVDTETGVHYLQTLYGSGGGITPLLGSDGKPVIRPVADDE